MRAGGFGERAWDGHVQVWLPGVARRDCRMDWQRRVAGRDVRCWWDCAHYEAFTIAGSGVHELARPEGAGGNVLIATGIALVWGGKYCRSCMQCLLQPRQSRHRNQFQNQRRRVVSPPQPAQTLRKPQEKTAPKKLPSTLRSRDTRSQIPELTEDIIRYRTITALNDQTKYTNILMRRHRPMALRRQFA